MPVSSAGGVRGIRRLRLAFILAAVYVTLAFAYSYVVSPSPLGKVVEPSVSESLPSLMVELGGALHFWCDRGSGLLGHAVDRFHRSLGRHHRRRPLPADVVPVSDG